jgi:hypothetical protein
MPGLIVNGLAIPREVEAAGPTAIDAFVAAQTAPAEKAAPKKSEKPAAKGGE